ncbi:hypothetical protein MNBD_GAMMA21-2908 [hydrothermal vent metagenome]|uniref:Uncharacterized protein n=1 Tax=hydrothermal vent metagenome TaxID=652676 RepID=A0A3B1A8D7_9ZZZZ
MKIKDYIIVVLVIGVSFSAYHLYAKNETKETGKPCGVIVNNSITISFSTEISGVMETEKTWDSFQKEIESVVKKLNLSSLTKEQGSYHLFKIPSQISTAEGNENKVSTFRLGVALTYTSKSAEPLSVLMSALNKSHKYEVVLSISRDDGCF